MLNLKKFIQKLLYPHSYDSEAFVKYLKLKGCKIGKGTYFFDPKNTIIDGNRLNFIEIGENCSFTRGVVILGHDYSYSVLRKNYHQMLQKAAITKIGDNVFIGLRSVILMGTEIGDNVIIGANSVVSGKIPANSVWAGNPAKQICTLEEYYNKLNAKFEQNAKLHAKRIIETTGKKPTFEQMEYFITLFTEKNSEARRKYLEMSKYKGYDKEEMIQDLMKVEPKYKDFNDFLSKLDT